MRRREFIAGLGSAAAWPAVVRAQQPPIPVVGYLYAGGGPEASGANQPEAFRKGLSEAGFVEGRNVAIEYRWARNDHAQLPELSEALSPGRSRKSRCGLSRRNIAKKMLQRYNFRSW